MQLQTTSLGGVLLFPEFRSQLEPMAIVTMDPVPDLPTSLTMYLPPGSCVPDQMDIPTDPGQCTASIDLEDAGFDDNCGVVTIEWDFDGDGTFDFTGSDPTHAYPTGTSTSTFQVTDASGNSASCTFTVSVVDEEDPVANCNDITIQLDATGNYSLVQADLDAVGSGSTDNCETNFTVTPDDFDCDDFEPGTQNDFALSLDGDDDYISTNLNLDDAVVPSTTWEAWVRPTDPSNGNFGHILTIDDLGWDRFVALRDGSFWSGFGNSAHLWVSADINSWQHIAIIYTGNQMRFYKNGVEYLFPGSVNTAAQNTNQSFLMGGSFNSNTSSIWEFFQGDIDEVRVWKLCQNTN